MKLALPYTGYLIFGLTVIVCQRLDSLVDVCAEFLVVAAVLLSKSGQIYKWRIRIKYIILRFSVVLLKPFKTLAKYGNGLRDGCRFKQLFEDICKFLAAFGIRIIAFERSVVFAQIGYRLPKRLWSAGKKILRERSSV